VADRLLSSTGMIADAFDGVSILFLDMVSFTTLASRIPPAHLVHLLDAVFAACDEVCQRHGLTKIKTIGDAYLAVAGVPLEQEDHALRMAAAAVEMMRTMKTLDVHIPDGLGDRAWINEIEELEVRVGIHCGPVVAGVIGRDRVAYDVWGDSVNVASRMERNGAPGRIHVSEDFAHALTEAPYNLIPRGDIEVKGKGRMKTFWLEVDSVPS
jgi:class 3 adenylate cyclase